jgi:hypothetical protein
MSDTTTGLDYTVLDTAPEGTVDSICEATEDAADGAAPLVLLITAMRSLGVEGTRQDAILTEMARLGRLYQAGQ